MIPKDEPSSLNTSDSRAKTNSDPELENKQAWVQAGVTKLVLEGGHVWEVNILSNSSLRPSLKD